MHFVLLSDVSLQAEEQQGNSIKKLRARQQMRETELGSLQRDCIVQQYRRLRKVT
jgi:hypothetical protein